MEELDLKELLNIFWNKKLQIILIVSIFLIIGIIYTVGFVTPMYSSSTTLILASSGNATGATTNTITTTDLTVNSKLVPTYREIVRRKSVLREVIDNLGIDVQEETLKSNVSVNSVENTEVIEITVKNENSTYAAQIANEIAKVFTKKVKEIYNIDNVQILDEAEVNPNPSNINHIKDITIFGLIGLVMAVAYVLILNILDTTVKTAEDIERSFDVPVLVSIPLYGVEAKKGKTKAKGGRR